MPCCKDTQAGPWTGLGGETSTSSATVRGPRGKQTLQRQVEPAGDAASSGGFLTVTSREKPSQDRWLSCSQGNGETMCGCYCLEPRGLHVIFDAAVGN